MPPASTSRATAASARKTRSHKSPAPSSSNSSENDSESSGDNQSTTSSTKVQTANLQQRSGPASAKKKSTTSKLNFDENDEPEKIPNQQQMSRSTKPSNVKKSAGSTGIVKALWGREAKKISSVKSRSGGAGAKNIRRRPVNGDSDSVDVDVDEDGDDVDKKEEQEKEDKTKKKKKKKKSMQESNGGDNGDEEEEEAEQEQEQEEETANKSIRNSNTKKKRENKNNASEESDSIASNVNDDDEEQQQQQTDQISEPDIPITPAARIHHFISNGVNTAPQPQLGSPRKSLNRRHSDIASARKRRAEARSGTHTFAPRREILSQAGSSADHAAAAMVAAMTVAAGGSRRAPVSNGHVVHQQEEEQQQQQQGGVGGEGRVETKEEAHRRELNARYIKYPKHYKRPLAEGEVATNPWANRKFWTDVESRALVYGLLRYEDQKTKWASIKDDPEFAKALENRTTVNMKDRMITLNKAKNAEQLEKFREEGIRFYAGGGNADEERLDKEAEEEDDRNEHEKSLREMRNKKKRKMLKQSQVAADNNDDDDDDDADDGEGNRKKKKSSMKGKQCRGHDDADDVDVESEGEEKKKKNLAKKKKEKKAQIRQAKRQLRRLERYDRETYSSYGDSNEDEVDEEEVPLADLPDYIKKKQRLAAWRRKRQTTEVVEEEERRTKRRNRNVQQACSPCSERQNTSHNVDQEQDGENEDESPGFENVDGREWVDETEHNNESNQQKQKRRKSEKQKQRSQEEEEEDKENFDDDTGGSDAVQRTQHRSSSKAMIEVKLMGDDGKGKFITNTLVFQHNVTVGAMLESGVNVLFKQPKSNSSEYQVMLGDDCLDPHTLLESLHFKAETCFFICPRMEEISEEKANSENYNNRDEEDDDVGDLKTEHDLESESEGGGLFGTQL